MSQNKAIWISWEEHRRSKELADAFSANLYEVLVPGGRLKRYLLSLIKTTLIIISEKPKVVFAQAPSTVLCYYCCILKFFLRYKLVIDAHNSVPNQIKSGNPILFFINTQTLKLSDFVIVTNTALFPELEKHGGSMLCLPDRPPTINTSVTERGEHYVLIASYQPDEPVEEVLQAFSLTGQNRKIFVTGRKPKNRPELDKFKANEQINFTGFLPEEDYEELIASARLLIDLTTDDYILVCGGYEAIAVGVPSIVSDTDVSKEVFAKGFLYARPEAESIKFCIEEFETHSELYNSEIKTYASEYQDIWQKQFERLKSEAKL